MMRQEVLDKAAVCVNVDRQNTYGKPEDNFARIAAMWEAYLGTPITSAQVAVCMILTKVARLNTSIQHADNWVDIAGYAACGAEIADAS